MLYYAFGPLMSSQFVKHNAWNYLLLHINVGGVVLQERCSTDCTHWKGTNMNIFKLNLILEEENEFQVVEK